MTLKENVEQAIYAISQASTGMEMQVAEAMYSAAVRSAKAWGFNIGVRMTPDGKLEALLISVSSPADDADAWTLSEWDELYLGEMKVKWVA